MPSRDLDAALLHIRHSKFDTVSTQYVEGQLERSKKPVSVRGLDPNHNHHLKDLFKGAAIQAATREGPFREFYEALVAKGMRPEMARLTPGAKDCRGHVDRLEERSRV